MRGAQCPVRKTISKMSKIVLTTKKLGAAAAKVMSNYAKKGNTTIVSAGITIQDEKPLLLFKHLSNNETGLLGGFLDKIGVFPKRKQRPRHFMYMRHDMEHLMPDHIKERNDFYDIIGIKHWYDGSPYIGSMYLEVPYLNTELTNNKLNIPVRCPDLKSSLDSAMLYAECFNSVVVTS